MTKVSDEDIFAEFYEKILSAELVAPQYDLVLTDESTNIQYEFKGTWNKKDMVTVRTGRYHVVGTSTATGVSVQDKCSFVFDEYIDISSSATQITLTAQYDCFLIIFNAAGLSTLSNYNGTTSRNLSSFSTYKYAFVNDKLYLDDKQDLAYINGRYTDGAEFKCYTGQLVFEKGKYYVYNSVTGTFTVPSMENGNQHIEAVNLGLSVKWATCNLGATCPEEYGNYYAWGETEIKDSYAMSTYKWYGSLNPVTLTKYNTNSSYGDVDNKTVLDAEDDVAQMKLGGNWRMPTDAEWTELRESCTWIWTTLNGVSGRLVTGPNDNSIFLPATGRRSDDSFYSVGSKGYYWSSSIESVDPYCARYVAFDSDGVYRENYRVRYTGLSIRPVSE